MSSPRALMSLSILVAALAVAPPASAQVVLQPDAAPPGAGLVVSLISANGGFSGAEVITTSCDDLLIGPTWLSDGAGNPSSPIQGAVLSTVFFVLENATPSDCDVFVDGVPLIATGAIDNVFSIVTPLAGPVDGGAGDLDGVEDGVITVPSSARSDGGVVVFDNLNVPEGKRLVFDTTDPVPATGGNEAYMPIIVLVRGDVVIDGIVDASGEDGHDRGDNRLARSFDAESLLDGGDGGHGGPGGGGGAAGGPHNSTTGGGSGGYSGTGGDGFGGGSGSPSIVFNKAPGGAGVAFPPVEVTGGNSPFNRGGGFPTDQVTNGGGGGSGNPFGDGGHAGLDGSVGGAAGFGGGGGAATNNGTSSGGGGGGFATAGEPGGLGQTNGGRGGHANGLTSLLPLMGGSGGGGGDGWITGGGPYSGDYGGGGGGGGGGAFMLVSFGALSGGGQLLAGGGVGGAAGTGNQAASGGGGGSGGAVFLAARAFDYNGTVDIHGGIGGDNAAFPGGHNLGGSGGEGRVRFDGAAPPSLQAGPTGATGSTYQGCAVASVDQSTVTTSSPETCDYVALDIAGNTVGTGSVQADGAIDLSALFDAHGPLTVILSRGGVPSPVGIARVIADSDGDSIPDFADADSDDDGIPDLVELGGLDLSGDGDKDGVPDYLDPDAVACPDLNGDGVCDSPPAALDADGDGIADFLDLDSDGDGIPDVVENGTAHLDADRDGRIDDREDRDFDGLAGIVDADDGDAHETGSLAGVLSSDADALPDYLDLDSDGDGFSDLVEAGGSDGDGDGRLDGAQDGDGDGLAAQVDPDEGGAPLALPDDDGDGRFDFQDLCGDRRLSVGEVCDAGGDAGATPCGCDALCAYPLATPCDDGLFCTAVDRCDGAGACDGVGAPCGADTPYCDEGEGACVGCLVAAHCPDDGDLCTRAACEAGACVYHLLDLGLPDGCDGLDNDCDGATDEDFRPSPVSCGLGACAGNTGVTACSGGVLSDDCAPLGGATDEVCDGVDNDCDGLTDASLVDPGAQICAPLDTVILTGPPAVTARDEAPFTYADSVTAANTDFQCSLDGGPWFECDGGAFTATQIGEGGHTLLVRAEGPGGQVDATPAYWVWVVDRSVPDTLIVVGPDDPSQSDAALFVFGSSDPTASEYRCALDPATEPPAPADFVPCDMQTTFTELGEGGHALWVYVINPAGVADPTPASRRWSVDTSLPETEISAGPADITAASSATLSFLDPTDLSVTTFRCRLNADGGGAWEPCDGGARVYDGLGDGEYRFEVASVDAAGNVDPTPARWRWVVDQAPPDTFITVGPDDPSQSASAAFAFDASEAPVTYRCALDPEPSPPGADQLAPCDPAVIFSSLSEGEHALWVQAVDEAGNADPTPAEWRWEIDTSSPETLITSGPPVQAPAGAGADFAYEDPSDSANTLFECSLDGEAWARCDDGALSYPAAEVELGQHVFEVRACEALADGGLRCDPTPALWSWLASDSPCPLDDEAPALACAGDQRLECVAGGAATDVAGFAATATDTCGPVDVSWEAPASFPLGVTPVVFQALDGNGNLSACLTRVVVEDTTAPTIACPDDRSVTTGADACARPVALEAPAVEDLCDDNATLRVFDDAPARFAPGDTLVTYTVLDRAGHHASCATTVTVVDDAPPVLSCPDARILDAPADRCSWEGTLSAELSDNCAPSVSVIDETKAWPVGESEVRFEAGSGEAADPGVSCTTVLTVRDVTAPEVSCGEAAGEGPAVVVATADDACGASISLRDLACERVDAGGRSQPLSAADCSARVEGATVVIPSGLIGAELRVSWTAAALDPSGNEATAPCALTLDPLPEPDDASGYEALGGGGCQGATGGGLPWALALVLVSAWLLWRRGGAADY